MKPRKKNNDRRWLSILKRDCEWATDKGTYQTEHIEQAIAALEAAEAERDAAREDLKRLRDGLRPTIIALRAIALLSLDDASRELARDTAAAWDGAKEQEG